MKLIESYKKLSYKLTVKSERQEGVFELKKIDGFAFVPTPCECNRMHYTSINSGEDALFLQYI